MFKEFFEKTFGEFSHLITESPMEMNPLDNFYLNDINTNYDLTEFILDKGIKIGDFEELEVYHHKREWEDIEHLFFIHGKQIIASQIDYETHTDDGIVINFVWKRKGAFSTIVPRIYCFYLLSEYSYILSDRTQTIKGFSIYKEIIQRLHYYRVRVFVVDILNDEEYELSKESDLHKYFGKDKQFSNYRFKLTK